MLPGRSKGSVEYKYQNVSGVLYELGFPYIPGYKPARNYQKRLLPDIVLEYLGSGKGVVAAIERAVESVPSRPSDAIDFSHCEVPAPRHVEGADVKKTRSKSRRARRFDFAAKDAGNRALGSAGEEFAVRREQWYLIASGRPDLATRVERVSKTRGDGLGYDVLSFDAATGDKIYIEVKTTNRDKDFPFYLSEAEIDASLDLAERYRLYRVFNFSTAPLFYKTIGDLRRVFHLRACTYEARRA